MKIQLLSVQTVSATSKGGKPYNQLDVAYKNLTSGKVEGKKLMPFGGGKAAFDALSTAAPNAVFEIKAEKNANGYWDWVSAIPSTPDAAPQSAAAPAGRAGNPAPKSNYETPEERAARQIYIVRQSSVANAVAILSPGSKSALDVDLVLDVAKRIEDYVFDKGPVVEPTPEQALVDMGDDIPY